MASIRVKGLDVAAELTAQMEARLRDMTPVLRVAAEDLKTLTDDSFRQSRSPDGTPWKPLAPQTVNRRRNRSDKPLIDTGTLRGSINARATRKTLRIGTNVRYAGVHQFGGKHIPARPFLPVERSGSRFSIMRSGPAGREVRRIKAAIVEYIRSGRVS